MSIRKIQWQKSDAIERILKESGLDWEIEDIPFNQIDLELSSNNHARRLRIDESVVSDYLAGMEHGDDFPCGVAVKQPGTGKYLILGGNHTRQAAEEFGQKSMGFYVVSTKDPVLIDILPKMLNRRHGLRKSKEEAVQDAINAIAQHGLSPQAAADKFGVHVHTLHVNNRAAQAVRRFKKLGVRADGLPRASIIKLNAIVIDSVAEEAVRLAEKQRMTGPEVHTMVNAIFENRSSEKTQMAVIDEFRTKLSDGQPIAKPGGSHGTEMEKLWARYTRALTLLDVMLRNKKSVRQLGCKSEKECERIAVLQKSLAQKLHALSAEGF